MGQISSSPGALALFCPAVDFVRINDYEDRISKDLAQKISPLHQLRENMPPTLVLIGTNDPLLSSVCDFIKELGKVNAQTELYLAKNQRHSFLSKTPWCERTLKTVPAWLVWQRVQSARLGIG